MVGRQPGSGPQKVSIGRGCGYLGVVVHEVGMYFVDCFDVYTALLCQEYRIKLFY